MDRKTAIENSKKAKIGLLLLFVLLAAFPSANVSARSLLLKNTAISSDRHAREIEDSIEKARQQKLDSLMASIQPDSITDFVYSTFPPYYPRPMVLGDLRSVSESSFTYPPISYSSLAGTINDTQEEGLQELAEMENEDGTVTELERVPKIEYSTPLNPAVSDPIPEWFKKLVNREHRISDANYRIMVGNPAMIEYADWSLPVPPVLPEQDFSFRGFLARQNLPDIDTAAAILPEPEVKKVHWLHKFNVGLQFSQAYVSANWYQGGNSYLAGLFNINWNVDLNQAFHPKLLFQSAFEYKLGVNSNPKGSLHKYNTSQDLLQYSLKAGLKAFNDHWYYSLNLLFQTQIFNSYPEDSEQRSSTFLSPGMLNIGIGMTYNLSALKDRLKLSASISPLAYNLKTCLAKDIDRAQFGMDPGQKALSEVGSSAEINLTWNFTDNISWKSRLFLFTDYHYFLADWENTFNFQINKYLSSQIFIHPRFDSSMESSTKWRHWMLREVLSFGVSYTFSTAP